MKKILVFTVVFTSLLGSVGFSQDCTSEECKSQEAQRKSPANYDDGNVQRIPSSPEAPYPDEDLKQGQPETFKGKNMPVDQD